MISEITKYTNFVDLKSSTAKKQSSGVFDDAELKEFFNWLRDKRVSKKPLDGE